MTKIFGGMTIEGIENHQMPAHSWCGNCAPFLCSNNALMTPDSLDKSKCLLIWTMPLIYGCTM